MNATATTMHTTLQKFLAKPHRDTRTHLQSPMRTTLGIAYTNGHVLAVIPDTGQPDAQPYAKLDNELQIMHHMLIEFRGRAWVDLPSTLPTPTPCTYCAGTGTGKVRVSKCHVCNGDGEFEHHSYTYFCQACEGSGEIDDPTAAPSDCFKCDGSGHEFQAVLVGGCWFQRKYIALLQELGVERMNINTQDPMGVAVFVFGEDFAAVNFGAISPCRNRQ